MLEFYESCLVYNFKEHIDKLKYIQKKVTRRVRFLPAHVRNTAVSLCVQDVDAGEAERCSVSWCGHDSFIQLTRELSVIY